MRLPSLSSIFVAAALGASAAAPGLAAEPAAAVAADDVAFFEASVRPVLVANCYECHSLERGKSKGGLTLDTRAGWQTGGHSGPPIVPGDPDRSLLVKAVRHIDPELRMPDRGSKLSAAEIAALAEWVRRGAPDPRDTPPDRSRTGLTESARSHRSFQPVTQPAVPPVSDAAWVKSPIDAFILSALEGRGLTPNPAADRQALIRRASFDLIGLPPSPREVIDFVHDRSPQAWEKVIDRLLDSPHYGERWGRHWLDTARYSDTTGGERKVREDYRFANAWTYRDYVIRSFNEDKPYDRFIIEQLAADRLPVAEQGPNRASLAALGFLTVGQRFQNPNDVINDRIDAVSKGFLGLTVTCARCHDHKFDPISQADYYALHGVFASTVEMREKPVLADVSGPEHDEYLKKRAVLDERNRKAFFRSVSRHLTQICRKAEPVVLLLAEASGRGRKLDPARRLALIREHQLDPNLVRRMVRNRRDGRRARSRVFWPVYAYSALPKAGFAERAAALAQNISGPQPRQPVNALVRSAFEGQSPQSMADVAAIYGRIFAALEPQVESIVNACAQSRDGSLEGIDRSAFEIMSEVSELATADQLDTESLRERVARWQPRDVYRAGFVFGEINELDLTHPGAPPRAMAVEDAATPRHSAIFIRGQAEVKGDVVPRRFLEIFGGNDRPFRDGSGRLELARAIADPANPLTARTAVNRIWMHHFGAALIATPDDLGVQSEPASHPELLDWLAANFVGRGWSMKSIHRLILLSNAWQQSSETHPAGEKIDPRNRLLWRANIRRLDFESVRDSLLVVSGRLDPAIFGRPVNLTEEPYSLRRSVYGYIDRGNLPDLMQAFDFSDPDMPNSQRATTVVPQQALYLMNSPMSADVARHLVDRKEFADATDDTARVRALYEILFQRWPKPGEIAAAREFLAAAGRSNLAPAVANADLKSGRKSFRPGERIRDRRQELRAERRAKLDAAMGKGRRGDRRPIQNEGEPVARQALTPWEQYAQALLFTNELACVN